MTETVAGHAQEKVGHRVWCAAWVHAGAQEAWEARVAAVAVERDSLTAELVGKAAAHARELEGIVEGVSVLHRAVALGSVACVQRTMQNFN